MVLLLRSIFFTFLLPGSVTVLVPYLVLRSRNGETDGSPARYLGLPLIVAGALGLLWCIWQFFAEGRGTLAPVDPPTKLAIKGLYRYVRNPMYISVVAVLLGEAILFLSSGILIEAIAFFICAHAFIIL